MKIRKLLVTTIVFGLVMAVSSTCFAKESPYRVRCNSWPNDIAESVARVHKRLSLEVVTGFDTSQLYRNKVAVVAMDEPLSLKTAKAMFSVQAKETDGWAVLWVKTKVYKPIAVYDWLMSLVDKHVPDNKTHLEFVNTLGKIFEIRSGSSLKHWQCFKVTAFTVFGKMYKYVLINVKDGHVLQIDVFSNLGGMDMETDLGTQIGEFGLED